MNNTMVREMRGAKINPKSSFKNQGAQNTRGWKLRKQIWYVKYITTFSATGINSSLYPVNVRKQQAGSVYCKNYF